jgi:hypothetical protein
VHVRMRAFCIVCTDAVDDELVSATKLIQRETKRDQPGGGCILYEKLDSLLET